jgi:hypothetical protein
VAHAIAVFALQPHLKIGPCPNRKYCSISINSAHYCDCDTLDQFSTLAQVGRDCDKAKISALVGCKNIILTVLDTKIGVAEGCESENR